MATACPAKAGEVQCREDAHCAVLPDAARCWMGVCIAEPGKRALPDTLIANTWTLVGDTATGGRTGPIFVFVPQLGRFVVSAGIPGATKAEQLHFSTEHLDLETRTFYNAYPPGASSNFVPDVGPTQAPPHPRWQDVSDKMTDSAGLPRMPFFNGQKVTSNAYFQWTYAPDRGLVYAYLYDRVLSYDPATHIWSNLAVTRTPANNSSSLPAGSRDMMWGALGYDPIHHELVLVGGSAPVKGGSPGTWVFSLDSKTWRRVELGSTPINAMRREVVAIKTRAQALIGRLRNRLFATETPAENQQDFSTMVSALQDATTQTLDRFDPLQLPPLEQAQGKRTAGHLAKAKAAALAIGLQTPLSAADLAEVQDLIDALQWAELALAVEPPARGLSQLAYHPQSASLVLFGGDGMDRQYADTWVYDCATRRWSQRYPALSPSPRAGHALLTLPKSNAIVLVGGYTFGNGHSYFYRDAYRNLAGEAWTYDPVGNTWSKLAIKPARLPNLDTEAPEWRANVASPWTAAVNEEDVLIWLPITGTRRKTWALALDTTLIDATGTTKQGVPPETLLFRGDEDIPRPGYSSYDPAFYDRQPIPAGHVLDDLAASVRPNLWVALDPPKGVDTKGWGKAAIDSDRRQILYWGGGHSQYKGTNVMHYSLAKNRWNISSRPDWVLEWSPLFFCPAELSFNNRPMLPVHSYQAYAYDPPSGQMLAVSHETVWRYDVAEREWLFPPFQPPFKANVRYVAFETTPRGVVVWGDDAKGKGRFFRYDAASEKFKSLPMKGPPIGPPWTDRSGMVYDSKRDALWIATGDRLYRYDLASGNLIKVATTLPAVLDKFAFWRETVYLPDADILLLMARFGPADATFNVAYDPAANTWYSIALPFDDGKEHEFSWNSAMVVDAASGMVLLHKPVSFWALKLDRDTAPMTELR